MQSITTGKAEVRSLNRERFNTFLRKYAIIFIFLAMFIALALLSPAFLQPRNLLNIVRQISVMGLIAIGVTKVIITGGIDLSSGSVLALAAVIASSLAQRPDSATLKFVGLSVPLIVPIVAALAVGAFCGAVNGTLVAKFKIPPFIATLGMMTVAPGLIQPALMKLGRPMAAIRISAWRKISGRCSEREWQTQTVASPPAPFRISS